MTRRKPQAERSVMSKDPNPIVVASALSKLLTTSSFIEERGSLHRISLTLPDGREIAGEGTDKVMMIGSLCVEIMKSFPENSSLEKLKRLGLVEPICPPGTGLKKISNAKVPQKTIGVVSTVSLLDMLEAAGRIAGEDKASVARRYFLSGFEALDKRLDDEDRDCVFKDFLGCREVFIDKEKSERKVRPNVQWPLRLDPRAYGRAVVRAHEHGQSLSGLAVMCLSYALTRSRGGQVRKRYSGKLIAVRK
ncbi:hypothetical protein VDG44_09910 [Xanthomonas campestris pv. raphani]|uniref:hypothetical protein n=1 Tax=Xanthomonas campestris TaxID=339 RepID=UPI002B23E918|nr:hypothetical protein [Xanthomonas campestris]MEA9904869.1 hypothetical protein [Xanthomonas campestris pv. raphani]